VVVALLLLTACLDGGGATPVTTAQPDEIQRDGEPSLTEVPEDPRDEIRMVTRGLEDVRTGVDQYLERVPGYAEGSVRTEAIHPGPGGPSAIVRYEADDRILGPVSCVMVAPLGAATGSPPTAGGCVPLADVSGNQLVGMSYQSEGAEPYILVRHSPDSETVVVELADGEFFVIWPNGSTVSFHRWAGSVPVGVTVFWSDGSTSHEALSG
jgi:hypothetical protein